MKRLLSTLVLCVFATGCSSPPVAYGPNDTDDTGARGVVKPLHELIPPNAEKIKLIMIHGVGDHCPGYALTAESKESEESRWLNKSAQSILGLTPNAPVDPPILHTIHIETFADGAPDSRAVMNYATKSFSMQLGSRSTSYPVEAIEVTWSRLTQWIKNEQLGYDSRAALPKKQEDGCPTLPRSDGPPEKSPPHRLWLNRTIKEPVLDRSLADAMIYVGSYGEVIERGVADVLCRAIAPETKDDAKCVWPKANELRARNERFVFLTHSLGSRILYDVILHLTNYQTTGRSNPFTPEEIDDRHAGIEYLFNNTDAIYMMANQLPLLGLANIPSETRSDSGPWRPYNHKTSLSPQSKALLEGISREKVVNIDAGADIQPGDIAPLSAPGKYDSTLDRLRTLRANAATRLGAHARALPIIAFNDTNDLLTWHIPRWYGNSEPDQQGKDERPPVQMTNVFVQNATKLLVLESPDPAHTGYFSNTSVWQAVSCGMDDGKLRDPCK